MMPELKYEIRTVYKKAQTDIQYRETFGQAMKTADENRESTECIKTIIIDTSINKVMEIEYR
jgi:hypothetical protein